MGGLIVEVPALLGFIVPGRACAPGYAVLSARSRLRVVCRAGLDRWWTRLTMWCIERSGAGYYDSPPRPGRTAWCRALWTFAEGIWWGRFGACAFH
jgi:hypothetical protein